MILGQLFASDHRHPHGPRLVDGVTKESIIDQAILPKSPLTPLFSKEGKFLPFVKGGKEGFSLGVYIIMDLLITSLSRSRGDGRIKMSRLEGHFS